MRILYVVTFPFPGTTGTPLHAMGIAELMQHRSGFEVEVADLRPWPLFRDAKDGWNGIPIHRIARPGWVYKLAALIKRYRPDVVHAHHVVAAVFGLLACKRRHVPLVYECHSFWREELEMDKQSMSPVMKYVGWREKSMLRNCAHVIALSEKMKQAHVNEHRINPEKITVIYPGVKKAWIAKEDRKPAPIQGIAVEDFVVMYSGNYEKYQGVDLLLGARRLIGSEIPQLKIVLVGGGPPEVEQARSEWRDIDQYVCHVERRPYNEMPGYLARADMLAMPRPDSRICWTMPRKFGEYLSAGRPVLATDVGDHRRIIERYNCGLVSACTVNGLETCMRTAVALNSKQMFAMREGARRAAEECFDWDKLARQFESVYAMIR